MHVGVRHSDAAGMTAPGGTARSNCVTSVAITTLLAPREAIMYIAAVNITLQVRKSLVALRGACAYMAVVTALQVRTRLEAL